MVDLPLHVGRGLCLCLVVGGRATRLVLDGLLVVVVVVVSDCIPSPGQGRQMALCQHPPYDPASTSWGVAKSQLPHHMQFHTTHWVSG